MIDLDRKYLVTMMEAGYIYVGMKRFDEATKIFEGLCCLAPNSEVPIVALGGVAFCCGNFKEAIRQYKQALDVAPDSHFAKVYLGEALFFSGKKDDALELLLDVHHADPDGAAGHFASVLLDAIHEGFTPQMNTSGKGKSDAKAKTAVH